MLPRMRTIDQAAAWLQDTDPGTAFTKTALRRLVVTGRFPSVRVGQKYLVNLDALSTFLAGDTQAVRETVAGIQEARL